MTLDEQRDVIERSLGERMLNHAFIILHQWLQEIGFDTYGDRLQSLEQNYTLLFQNYLTTNDPDHDHILDELTGETYRLVDEVYADICIKRGRYPQLNGFDATNVQSVIQYFGTCVRLREEDYEWLHDICIDHPQPSLALISLASMMQLTRDIFREESMLFFIDCMGSENMLIRNQAIASSILMLCHYDIRIDYFPHIQDAFESAMGDGEQVFATVLSFVRASARDLKKMDVNLSELDNQQMHDTLAEALGHDPDETPEPNEQGEIEHVISWIPSSEDDYLMGIVSMMPDTWVLGAIVGEDEYRQQQISQAYLCSGNMSLWWDNLDTAEQILLEQLRSESPLPQDYINYGHICFLRGDRLMAFENYREAQQLLGSNKAFLRIFRPDRRFLVDRGIPLEDVYLMEDQLLKR